MQIKPAKVFKIPDPTKRKEGEYIWGDYTITMNGEDDNRQFTATNDGYKVKFGTDDEDVIDWLPICPHCDRDCSRLNYSVECNEIGTVYVGGDEWESDDTNWTGDVETVCSECDGEVSKSMFDDFINDFDEVKELNEHFGL